MNPEQGLLVILEHLAVKLQVFFSGTVVRMLGPERRGLIQKLRTLLYLEFYRLRLLFAVGCILSLGSVSACFFLLRLNLLQNDITFLQFIGPDDLSLFCVRLREINLCGHKGTILLDHFTSLILVTELQTILVQEQGDLCTYL